MKTCNKNIERYSLNILDSSGFSLFNSDFSSFQSEKDSFEEKDCRQNKWIKVPLNLPGHFDFLNQNTCFNNDTKPRKNYKQIKKSISADDKILKNEEMEFENICFLKDENLKCPIFCNPLKDNLKFIMEKNSEYLENVAELAKEYIGHNIQNLNEKIIIKKVKLKTPLPILIGQKTIKKYFPKPLQHKERGFYLAKTLGTKNQAKLKNISCDKLVYSWNKDKKVAISVRFH